ncbi:MAG: chemotaxis response regulator protein-glutamate methylesterase [Bacteroidales bacterium]|nr:chemotaxis response regulator protein-glutamate methylesterase [Bacteroidales bacterium]
MGNKKFKVLIVDDSRIVSELLTELVESDADLTVMGTAVDPYEAVRLIQNETPDVILLDIEMPKMNGITFLKKIMSQHPIPVVIFSGVAEVHSQNAMDALRFGALDVIPKPKSVDPRAIEETRTRILFSLKAAALSRNRLHLIRSQRPEQYDGSQKEHPKVRLTEKEVNKVIVMGASIGGTQAIEYILTRLKPTAPPILITQHMPGGFTRSFAERLESICPLTVSEAEENQVLEQGHVYIANGYYHLQLARTGMHYKVRLTDDEPVNRHKPSVDVLFWSAIKSVSPEKLVAILLTGMGEDGARSMLDLKHAGALTIAQDEKSSVVWGMPGKAVKIGAATQVLSLSEITEVLNKLKC